MTNAAILPSLRRTSGGQCRTRQEYSVKPTDIARVQTYLRKLFGNDRIHLDTPKKTGATVEMRIGDEFVGTLHRDEEDGEVSFALNMVILDEDLPAAPKPR